MSATKKLFGPENPHVPHDIFNYILQFLPFEDRVRSRLVNTKWNHYVSSSPLWKQAARGGSKDIEDFVSRFNKLHPYIKKLVEWGACDLLAAEDITRVWQIHNNYVDHLPQDIKDKLLDPNYPHQHLATNYMAFALLRSGLINVDDVRTVPADVLNLFLSENNLHAYSLIFAIYALSKKLITLKQAAHISLDKLNFLFNKIGISALEKGWISISEVSGASTECLMMFLGDISNYYGHHGFIKVNVSSNMNLIKDGIMTLKAASELSIDVLSLLLSPIGNEMLREKLITPNQMKALPNSDYVQTLLSTWGKFALFNDLITVEEFGELPDLNFANVVLSKWGCIALRDGYITVDQIKSMPNAQYVAALLSKWGLEALKLGFVKPEQIQALPDAGFASVLLSEWGFKALNEGLITVDQLSSIPLPEYLDILMSKNGLTAIRTGLINLDNIPDWNINLPTFAYLLGEGFEALEKHIVTMSDVVHRDVNSVMNQVHHIQNAVNSISDYKTRLHSMNSKKISKNNKQLGLEKENFFEKHFSNQSLQLGEEELKKILMDKDNSLLSNRNKSNIKFFKVKSAFRGYKNPLLNDRYCESETEVRLVELYKACAAA